MTFMFQPLLGVVLFLSFVGLLGAVSYVLAWFSLRRSSKEKVD